MMQIDGRSVDARGTLLDACERAGAGVPALCRDERVSAGGHCRSCIVEVDGRHVAACTTPARAGAHVRTDTPALRGYRRHLLELMATEARSAGRVLDLAREFGATEAVPSRVPSSTSSPSVRVRMIRCAYGRNA